jgi:hypothetical protein
MNCYDCAIHNTTQRAVAICHDCGAGLCVDHAHTHDRYLQRMVPLGMFLNVEPPGRIIQCVTCSNANEALRHANQSRHRSSHKTQPAT